MGAMLPDPAGCAASPDAQGHGGQALALAKAFFVPKQENPPNQTQSNAAQQAEEDDGCIFNFQTKKLMEYLPPKLINTVGRLSGMLAVAAIACFAVGMLFLTIQPTPSTKEFAVFLDWEKSQTAQQTAQEGRGETQASGVTP